MILDDDEKLDWLTPEELRSASKEVDDDELREALLEAADIQEKEGL